jgi:hypothetical protein
MLLSCKSDLYHSFYESDADCGRGFSRIGDLCVNISTAVAASTDVAKKCLEIGSGIINSTNAGSLFQIQVSI